MNLNKLLEKIREARFVFICGNGGSSATAEHFTNDLFSKGIKAICLNSNTSIMTMIANDFGYEYVFSRQINLYGTTEDLLIVISGSGNSKNILNALEFSGDTFALLGMGGGMAAKVADNSIIIDSDDYGIVEDEHLKIIHIIKKLL